LGKVQMEKGNAARVERGTVAHLAKEKEKCWTGRTILRLRDGKKKKEKKIRLSSLQERTG